METESIKKFVEGFFNNLKCKVEWKNTVLNVENVPADFEKFSGKKGPYFFIFEQNLSCPINENIEMITKGSYMLKAMTNYLGGKGQTTLLRLSFDTSEQEVKDYLKLKNCNVFSINKKVDYLHFLRFTFLTNFQYLNEREQVMHSIFVKDKEIEDFDLEKFKVDEGKKQDITSMDIKLEYNLAKEELKQLIQGKINKIGADLDKKLEKEIERVKNHYGIQINEIDQQIESYNKQMKELEEGNTNGDLKNIPARINKLQEQIGDLKKADKKEKLVKEQEFFISDETNKHSLNVDNKLMNTTIIYYPVFDFNIFLKNSDTGRQISLTYNPLKKQITELYCDSCKKQLSEIILCTSGHIVCSSCSGTCGDCGKETCRDCLTRNCGVCGKPLCKKCSLRCLKCGKYVCKSHSAKDSLTGRELCQNCLKQCPFCKRVSEKIKACPSCGKGIACEKCLISNKNAYCNNCSQQCSSCGKIVRKTELKACCDYKDCNHLNRCMDCRKKLCVRLKLKK